MWEHLILGGTVQWTSGTTCLWRQPLGHRLLSKFQNILFTTPCSPFLLLSPHFSGSPPTVRSCFISFSSTASTRLATRILRSSHQVLLTVGCSGCSTALHSIACITHISDLIMRCSCRGWTCCSEPTTGKRRQRTCEGFKRVRRFLTSFSLTRSSWTVASICRGRWRVSRHCSLTLSGKNCSVSASTFHTFH